MDQQTELMVIDVDKIASATSPLALSKTVAIVSGSQSPRATCSIRSPIVRTQQLPPRRPSLVAQDSQ